MASNGFALTPTTFLAFCIAGSAPNKCTILLIRKQEIFQLNPLVTKTAGVSSWTIPALDLTTRVQKALRLAATKNTVQNDHV